MMKDNYKIYVHINKSNGKMYIGQTCQTIKRRFDNGKGYSPCIHFNRAIQKYGWDRFEHIVLIENLSLELANIFEEELIKKYNTTNPMFGYNLRSGGENSKLSEESKKKIRQARVGRFKGKDNPFYGKTLSDEAKQKISKANKGRLIGDKNPMFGVHLCGENHPNYGKKMSQEQKDKISLAKKGKKMSQEFKDHLSRINTGQNNPNYGNHKIAGLNHPRCREVIQFDKNGNFIRCYWGAKEAENLLGINHSLIARCCNGKVHTAGGYIWKYKDEVDNEQN